MDLFIPNGPGPLWEHELRYALRSWHKYGNIDRVFILGWKPWWIRNVEHFPFPDGGGPCNLNTLSKLAGAVFQTDISDRFIYSHDDIYLLKPFMEVHEHCAGDYRRSRLHREAFENAVKAVGRPGVLDYELHKPVVLEKDKVQQVIETIHERNIAFRTVYFNKIRVPSVPVGDVKLMSWREPPEDWSCFSLGPQVAMDRNFREWIKRRYPDPSPWEIEEL